mmetsp:Transcript_4541/g.28833  ORF Transcript_4541/g.28833 Transcript_4541/m.28833 type:complete len:237 (-) Transcript_4541:10-720(-)
MSLHGAKDVQLAEYRRFGGIHAVFGNGFHVLIPFVWFVDDPIAIQVPGEHGNNDFRGLYLFEERLGKESHGHGSAVRTFGHDKYVFAESHATGFEPVAVESNGLVSIHLFLLRVSKPEHFVQCERRHPVPVVHEHEASLSIDLLHVDAKLRGCDVWVHGVVHELGHGAKGPFVAGGVGMQELWMRARVFHTRVPFLRRVWRFRGSRHRVVLWSVLGSLSLHPSLLRIPDDLSPLKS